MPGLKQTTSYHFLFCVAILISLCNTVDAYIPIDQSGEWGASLNGEWKFMLNGPVDEFYKPDYDISEWAPIHVPGNWEVQGFEEPIYKEPRETEGLYRREFIIPASWGERRVFIRFEGVLYGFEFWINGTRVGQFESPFHRSEYDITKLIERDKPNLLAVRVYRRYKGWEFDTFDAWALSGIYRDVSLFTVGDVHIEDITITTEIKPDVSTASMNCTIDISKITVLKSDITLSGILSDTDGRIIQRTKSSVKRNQNCCELNFNVKKPLLWNAETPHLYRLIIELWQGNNLVHSLTKKIGIRQVSIDGDVFKLNHRPIKLRGVNHHDIHPEVGRALREKHYRQDIELMKKANINAVRTSHYPPHPMFLDLCDQYGLYVICEVPFGFGSKNLNDPSYENVLLKRADATVARDKNHPSILIWSIGNENPITPLVASTADRVKELDQTRFRLLPGAQDSKGKALTKGENPTEFAEKTKFIFNLPQSVEIAAPHYPYVKEITGRDRKINLTDLVNDTSIKRPIICTEYNHSLSSAFEGLKKRWDMIEAHDQLGGAFIWHWADQGLRRNIDGREVITGTQQRLTVGSKETAICADVWLDSMTVLDSHGGSGSDGIVYADRIPQVDYWITRIVYSPVIIPEDKLVVHQGKLTISFTLFNRYDFTSLDKLQMKYELLCNGKQSASGSLSPSTPPRANEKIELAIDLQNNIEITEHMLQIVVTDFNGRQIYEHAIQLVPESGVVDFSQRLATDAPRRDLVFVGINAEISTYKFGNINIHLYREKGKIKIVRSDTNTRLLEGPLIRVGRKPIMAEWRNYPRYDIKFWEVPLIEQCNVIECKVFQLSNSDAEITMKLDYPSTEIDRNGESILVDVILLFSQNGWIDINYTLTPQNATGNFLDFGLAFKMPGSMSNLQWLGDGPYNSYPGQSEAAQRGIWSISPKPITDPESRYYEGNRANVDLAAVTDKDGKGVGFVCYGTTISLQKKDDQYIFSQVLRSSGKGNKTGGMMTLLPVRAREITNETGKLRLVALEAGNWPETFKILQNN